MLGQVKGKSEPVKAHVLKSSMLAYGPYRDRAKFELSCVRPGKALIRGWIWPPAIVKDAALGPAMIATPDRFWGVCGDGMRTGVRDGNLICDLYQMRSARTWLISTILSAIGEMKLSLERIRIIVATSNNIHYLNFFKIPTINAIFYLLCAP